MQATDAGAVWGIGRKTAPRLKAAGIHSVLDLVHADIAALRREFGVVLERTVLELRGTSCLDVQDAPDGNQQIMCSRSFGEPVQDLPVLEQVVSQFTTRVAEKLRAQGSVARSIHVFITTSAHRRNEKQHSPSVTMPLARATADTRLLIAAAMRALQGMYRLGFNYVKAGVMLVDLQGQGSEQAELDLFADAEDSARTADRAQLMTAIDALNRRFGKDAVGVASAARGAGRAAPRRGRTACRPAIRPGWKRSPLPMPDAACVDDDRGSAGLASDPSDSPPTVDPSDRGWTYTISVRSFCEFTAKHGDLDRRFTPSATATEGQIGEAVAVARRAPGYQRQLQLSRVFEGLRVRGRADGFDPATNCLEEIKTIRGPVEAMPENRRRLHWAQLETYGALYCRARATLHVQLALVYVNADTSQETVLRELRTAAALDELFAARCLLFVRWAKQEAAHRVARDGALSRLAFPLPQFRPGQRALAEGVYRAALKGRCLLAQAPTGIGKTLGVLYPMLRAMPSQKLDKVAYLTCKNTGRMAAMEALGQLQAQMPHCSLRVLVLVAKDQACVNPGKACHGDACPLASGFYDKLPAARTRAAAVGLMDQQTLRDIAVEHGVCPYYLSQEMLRWSDIVVGDVHHAFDVDGQLHGLTQMLDWRVGLLVDEAHNLIDRTRQMYGAELRLSQLQEAWHLAPGSVKPALGALLRIAMALAADAGTYAAYDDVPERFNDALKSLNAVLAEHFRAQVSATGPVLDTFFRALQFQWTADRMGSHAFFDISRSTSVLRQAKSDVQLQADLAGNEARGSVPPDTVFCVRNVVPGHFLQRRWLVFHTVTLFSATLGAERYQRELLGLPEGTAWLDVASPFDPAHLCVKVARISTRYAHRARSLTAVVDVMAGQCQAHPGNYLAFFSSFAYLQQAAAKLAERWPDLPQWAQSSEMNEASRATFLQRFNSTGQGIGFAVLGGVFAEGIDLPGRRLIGAFIATLGLPAVSPEQNQMRDRLTARFGTNCGYADLVPGMQKVVQAAGRVIRAPNDRGWVCLVDDRYERAEVRALLPAAWGLGMQLGME